MLDVMSMCQFLIMTRNLLAVVAKAGGDMQLRLDALSRHALRAQRWATGTMVGFMRSIFGDPRADSPNDVKSTAISDAGLTKQTLYEVERRSVHPRYL